MEKNPGRYGIAALAIAALLGAAACERGTDNTATGLSERGTDTRSAAAGREGPSSGEQTASTTTPPSSPTAATGEAGTSSGAPGSLAASDEAARSDTSGTAATGTSSGAAGTAGVQGYTGPGGTTGTTTGSTAGTTGSAATGGAASGEMTRSKSLSSSDRNFVKEAAEDSMFEIAVARVAAEKASDPEVKSFASKLVDDHTKASDQLKQIAESRNMTLPTALPSAKQRQVDRLNTASATDFDRQFLQMIGVKGHKEDIAEFERASRRARDAEIREFAKSNLPTLREHLSSAQRLAANIGKSTTTPQGYTGEGSAAPGSSPEAQPSQPSQPSPEMGTTTTPQGYTGPGTSGGGAPESGSPGSSSGQ